MGYSTQPVEVKSSGKVLATIDVEVFDDIQTAVSFFTQKDEQGNVTQDGNAVCLDLINSGHRASEMNSTRTKMTRKASPIAQLRKVVKNNPEAEEKVNALLAELGLGSLS